MGAGLPRLRRAAGDAQSYAERMFRFPELDVLPPPAAAAALTSPASGLNVTWDPGAVDAVVAWTGGYPYFPHEVHLRGRGPGGTSREEPVVEAALELGQGGPDVRERDLRPGR